MGDDDYELIPHSELKKIEGEIEELRGRGTQSKGSAVTPSLDELSNSIKSLLTVFTEAKNELKIEDEEKELMTKKIDPMLQKLDNLLDQNEKLAEGILSLADMIKRVDFKVQSLQASIDKPHIDDSLFQKDDKPDQVNTFKADPFAQPFMQQSSPQFGQPQSQFTQSSSFGSQPPFGQQGSKPQSPSFGSQPQFGQSPSKSQTQSYGSSPMSQGSNSGVSSGSDSFSSPSSPSLAPKQFSDGIGMPPPPPPSPQKKKSFFGK